MFVAEGGKLVHGRGVGWIELDNPAEVPRGARVVAEAAAQNTSVVARRRAAGMLRQHVVELEDELLEIGARLLGADPRGQRCGRRITGRELVRALSPGPSRQLP